MEFPYGQRRPVLYLFGRRMPARGMPLFDASWSRRYTNTRKATGITSEKFEGNVAAAQALFAALDAADGVGLEHLLAVEQRRQIAKGRD